MIGTLHKYIQSDRKELMTRQQSQLMLTELSSLQERLKDIKNIWLMTLYEISSCETSRRWNLRRISEKRTRIVELCFFSDPSEKSCT